ncbi:hypothetical protein VNO80_14374 [Phaseolus coccineus]|uniref:Uncharacterized protein n=1 Tax=Phaseolus coccineus TaxID=3886 RepID=A0AAN9R1U0_PHACN
MSSLAQKFGPKILINIQGCHGQLAMDTQTLKLEHQALNAYFKRNAPNSILKNNGGEKNTNNLHCHDNTKQTNNSPLRNTTTSD